jgi:hypothetical protein
MKVLIHQKRIKRIVVEKQINFPRLILEQKTAN